MKKKIKNFLKNNYKLLIFYTFFVCIAFIRLDYQIYCPGGLMNLSDKIEIEDSYESEGSINLTYVKARPGTLLLLGLSYIVPSWDIVSIDESRIDDEPIEEIDLRNKIYLDSVNDNALIVAFDYLKMEYDITENGISITHIYENAETDLRVGDQIKSVENISISNLEDFSLLLETLNENQRINIKVLRDEKSEDAYAIIKKENNKNIIGILVSSIREINTKPKVVFKFKENEAGPSGGLMTTLKIVDMLTKKDITKGRIISGTGTISSTGEVGEISGVKYKLAGAVSKKSHVFICPSDNYEECLKEKEENNYDIRLIKASTFEQVLKELNY